MTVVLSIADAAEPKADKPLTADECAALVEQLANPSEPPFSKRYVHELPKGVTESSLRKSQQPIRDAYNQLSRNVEVALPALVKHMDDKRFSYVYEEGVSAVYRRETIGGACGRIFSAHVDVYEAAVTKTRDAEGRVHVLLFDYRPHGGFEKWWQARKSASLADLQLERLDWALKQPQPDFFSAKEWEAAKKSLRQMADQIRASKKPIPVNHELSFFSK